MVVPILMGLSRSSSWRVAIAVQLVRHDLPPAPVPGLLAGEPGQFGNDSLGVVGMIPLETAGIARDGGALETSRGEFHGGDIPAIGAEDCRPDDPIFLPFPAASQAIVKTGIDPDPEWEAVADVGLKVGTWRERVWGRWQDRRRRRDGTVRIGPPNPPDDLH